ncbi:fructosamine kinase family protein [Aestuariivivens sediminis]|uniref:fructosamine kinase family protein n=1 Tax=Aestuariivivens sediminis TaxID=2913557 RepID=UPI001F578DE8|nr:fructosamine kinase family protein [Aestuariivivens sediminis]
MEIILKAHLSHILNNTIHNIIPVSGGDISSAYRIETAEGNYFLKSNTGKTALEMFQAEARGLECIAKTNTIRTPKVYACSSMGKNAFLLLEYIESKLPSSQDFGNLGDQLAQLHHYTTAPFGLDHNNFIGSLPQSNPQKEHWADFYTEARLLPQLQLAKQNHLLRPGECPTKETIRHTLEKPLQQVRPSLLHGDLWSGNYLISTSGIPYLIDPAVYYGDHEVDIAMSKLFGGFGKTFYDVYFDHMPTDRYTTTRIAIYQLYYLLVHLNLFGRSYHGSVVSILRSYF